MSAWPSGLSKRDAELIVLGMLLAHGPVPLYDQRDVLAAGRLKRKGRAGYYISHGRGFIRTRMWSAVGAMTDEELERYRELVKGGV